MKEIVKKAEMKDIATRIEEALPTKSVVLTAAQGSGTRFDTFKRFVSPTMTKQKEKIAGSAYKRGWMATLKSKRRG
jgi:hypothetical protein